MNNKINYEYLFKLGNISKEAMNQEQSEALLSSLTDIIEMIEQVANYEIDENIEPLSHPVDASLTLHQDIVGRNDTEHKLVQEAPTNKSNYFTVPKILDKN